MNQTTHNIVSLCLADFGRDLLGEISEHGEIVSIKSQQLLVKQGQLVRHLPIVIDGVIKVFSEEDGIQFLLYYVYPGATCVFSLPICSVKSR